MKYLNGMLILFAICTLTSYADSDPYLYMTQQGDNFTGLSCRAQNSIGENDYMLILYNELDQSILSPTGDVVESGQALVKTLNGLSLDLWISKLEKILSVKLSSVQQVCSSETLNIQIMHNPYEKSNPHNGLQLEINFSLISSPEFDNCAGFIIATYKKRLSTSDWDTLTGHTPYTHEKTILNIAAADCPEANPRHKQQKRPKERKRAAY